MMAKEELDRDTKILVQWLKSTGQYQSVQAWQDHQVIAFARHYSEKENKELIKTIKQVNKFLELMKIRYA